MDSGVYNIGGYIIQNNLIDINPHFVDRENGDLRLLAGSPALNAGEDLSAFFTKDFSGNTRDSLFDIGAYEGTTSGNFINKFHVATNGNDSNPGTISEPFRTFEKGVSVLSPGDTTFVHQGTYDEFLRSGIPSGNSWSSPTTLMAYQTDTVILKPTLQKEDAIVNMWHYYNDTCKYSILKGIRIDGTNVDTSNGVKISDNAHDIHFVDCEIKSIGHNDITNAFYVDPSSDGNILLLRAHIHHNDRAAIYINKSHTLVEDCDLSYNRSGIFDNSGSNKFIKNKIHHNTTDGLFISAAYDSVFNNIVWKNEGNGINSAGNQGLLYNNTSVQNTSHGFNISGNSNVIKNNISIYSIGSEINDGGSSNVLSNNLTSGYPRFLDTANASPNFHLQLASQAIDYGTSLSEITTDFDGNSRPVRLTHDAGAYEYQGMAHAYYVDSASGNDSYPGTLGLPYLTLYKGISMVNGGDTLYVLKGTYAEEALIRKHGTGWSNAVVITAYDSLNKPVIRPTAVSNNGAVNFTRSGDDTAQYVLFSWFIINVDAITNHGIGITDAAHHIHVQNCEVKNANGVNSYGIYVASGSTNCRITSSSSHNNLNDGIRLSGSNDTIERCNTYNNKVGITLQGASNGVLKNKIYQNTNQGLFINDQSNNAIFNNVIWKNGLEGINFSGSYNKVYNNTSASNGNYGIYCTGDTNYIQNNITAFNSGDNLRNTGSGCTVDHNFITGDPYFIDTVTANYNIHDSSAAKDAGTTLLAVADDIVGTQRPQNSVYDKGAYEVKLGGMKRDASHDNENNKPAAPSIKFADNMNVSIYPNPAEDMLNIRINIGTDFIKEITIADITGKGLYTFAPTQEKGIQPLLIQIPVDHFAHGIYFVHVISNKNTFTQKVLVGKTNCH